MKLDSSNVIDGNTEVEADDSNEYIAVSGKRKVMRPKALASILFNNSVLVCCFQNKEGVSKTRVRWRTLPSVRCSGLLYVEVNTSRPNRFVS